MNRLGLVFDNRYFHHAIATPTPENPDRLRRLFLNLQQNYSGRYEQVAAREISLSDVARVHSSFYIDQLREHAVKQNPYSYDRDTYLMEESIPTAQLATGGCIALADKIMDGSLDYGFALIRPPGHHATAGRGMGFCLFNNVALTAEYLCRVYGLRRILIVDFDIHHANGTQEIFYDSREVFVLSIHQKDLFPFSGDPEDMGTEQGLGYSLNLPVHAQFGDHEYTYLLGRILQGVVEQYLPQIILVSAGYDGHVDDSISSTSLTTGWFGAVTNMLRFHAANVCENRLLYVMEGGYNPASLSASVMATIDALLDKKVQPPGIFPAPRADKVLFGHPLHEFWTV